LSRRFDFGISSFGNPARLRGALQSVCSMSTTDYRCFVVHNPGGEGDEQARAIIQEYAAANGRIQPIWMDVNAGYAGAVNKILEHSETEYVGYMDNDAQILTPGWDATLCCYLDRFHEVGMVFPNGGAYEIQRPSYKEVMWGVGFCWVLSRLAQREAGEFDATLGHQEEADYCLRVRMAGYRCAAVREVQVQHHATGTSDPAAQERINRGVVNWVNKWTRYFGGKNLNYHSPNTIRWEDWHPNSLYLEEYWLAKLPGLNDAPEVRRMDGRDYDLIKVPRLSGFYRGRII
jgi:GT2 family glycosyltransferase